MAQFEKKSTKELVALSLAAYAKHINPNKKLPEGEEPHPEPPVDVLIKYRNALDKYAKRHAETEDAALLKKVASAQKKFRTTDIRLAQLNRKGIKGLRRVPGTGTREVIEKVYADTKANRELGRVGQTYTRTVVKDPDMEEYRRRVRTKKRTRKPKLDEDGNPVKRPRGTWIEAFAQAKQEHGVETNKWMAACKEITDPESEDQQFRHKVYLRAVEINEELKAAKKEAEEDQLGYGDRVVILNTSQPGTPGYAVYMLAMEMYYGATQKQQVSGPHCTAHDAADSQRTVRRGGRQTANARATGGRQTGSGAAGQRLQPSLERGRRLLIWKIQAPEHRRVKEGRPTGKMMSMAKRWSRRFSGRRSGRGEVDDLSNDIVDYRSISVAALVRIKDELISGDLGANVEVCTLASSADELEAGATVRVVSKRRGKAKVRVPYEKRFFTVPEAVLCDKPRELWSTTDVCEFHVTEDTILNQEFYLPLLEQGEVGEPFQGAFVSHARECRFGDLVNGLVEFFRDRKGVQDLTQAFVWLDIFCANQPKLNQPDADLSEEVRRQRNDLLTYSLHAAIERFQERLVFFNSWDRPLVTGRLWCVWELYGAIKSGKEIELFFPPGEEDRLAELLDSPDGPDEIAKTVAAVDLANAKCHSKEARLMIVSYVKTLQGGFGAINQAVLDQVRSWLRKSATELARTRGVTLIKHNVGRLLHDMGEYDAALAQFEEVLALRTQQLGASHPDVLETKHEIARTRHYKGEFDSALTLYEEVLACRIQQLGDNHLSVLKTRYAIARVRQSKGESDAALALFEEVMALQTQQLGEDHVSVLKTRYCIARELRAKGEFDTALTEYEEMLFLFTQQLGENHPYVLNTRSAIARVLQSKGEYEAALAQFKEVLALETQQHGENHPSVLNTRHAIASVLQSKGEYDAALAQLEEVLALETQQLGENHRDVLTTRNWIAQVLQSKGEYDAALAQFEEGEYDAALAQFEEALALEKQQLVESHPSVLATRYAIASVLQDKGEYDAALAQFEEVLALYTQQLGENHPSVLNTRNAIASVLHSKGEYDAALAQFEEVLALRKQQLGENHPHVAIPQGQVADVLVDLGQFERGLGLAETALETFESSKIAPVRNVRALTTKGRALFGLGRIPEARECLKDAEESARGLGEQHPVLAAVWHAWGVGPPRDESKLRAALDVREARLGHEHPLTRRTRADLLSNVRSALIWLPMWVHRHLNRSLQWLYLVRAVHSARLYKVPTDANLTRWIVLSELRREYGEPGYEPPRNVRYGFIDMVQYGPGKRTKLALLKCPEVPSALGSFSAALGQREIRPLRAHVGSDERGLRWFLAGGPEAWLWQSHGRFFPIKSFMVHIGNRTMHDPSLLEALQDRYEFAPCCRMEDFLAEFALMEPFIVRDLFLGRFHRYAEHALMDPGEPPVRYSYEIDT
ncbi:Nephrocystin-3, partial [Durusdinium trenchii]